MSARTVLVCNSCGAVKGLTPPASTRSTRLALKAKGWVYWKRGADSCPPCAKVEIAARKVAASFGYV